MDIKTYLCINRLTIVIASIVIVYSIYTIYTIVIVIIIVVVNPLCVYINACL